jgi:hypothetical protein
MKKMETQQKQHKQPKEKRHYFAQKARDRRIKDRKCTVCGEQAFGRILLTGELRCEKHLVEPLKESLIKKYPKKETKNEETKRQ